MHPIEVVFSERVNSGLPGLICAKGNNREAEVAKKKALISIEAGATVRFTPLQDETFGQR
jgi:hypothetical protein